jgi:hypothetical protein
MGIIIPESKSLNNGVVLSDYYIGLRKNIDNKVNIHVEFDPSAEITAGGSSVYKLTSYFEHHINRDAKVRGKSHLDNQCVTIDINDLGTSNASIISQLYTELKKQYTDFVEDI